MAEKLRDLPWAEIPECVRLARLNSVRLSEEGAKNLTPVVQDHKVKHWVKQDAP